jgi:hypothetical protein
MDAIPYRHEDDRMKILHMVDDGSITPGEGASLLAALKKTPTQAAIPLKEKPEPSPDIPAEPQVALPTGSPRWFRVRVTDMVSGKNKVTVNLPFRMVNWGLRMGARYSPELAALDMNQIEELMGSMENGKLVEVIDEEDGEHVEIYVE